VASYPNSLTPIIPLVGLLALAACSGSAAPTEKTKAEMRVGRFRVVNVSGSSETIQLDTVTGKTWRLVSTGPSEVTDVTAWVPVDDLTQDEWRSINAQRPSMLATDR
jgi:hypothetical protein